MCRSRLVLLLTVVVIAIAVPASEASAQTLPPPNPVCVIGGCHEEGSKDGKPPDRTSCPLPATLVCAGGSLIGGAVGAVDDVAQAGIGVAGDAVMGGLTSWVAGGAAWLLERAGRLLERSTRPALGSTWFRTQYRTMIGLAVGLSLLFLLCALLQATFRQDPRSLVRSALLALPLSLLLCFAAVTLVESALGVTDWMTGRVLQRFERDTEEFFADVGEVLVPASLSGSPLPGFLLFLGGLITALATFVVWLELVMREAAIYVAVAFLPLCFSAMVWERTAHWCRRLVELLAAIILAKLTIAVAIALAAGAMGNARGGEGGLTALMAGCAVMLISALTPWLLLRLIPIAEAAGHVAIHRGAARAAIATAPGAQTAAMIVRQSVLRSAGPASMAARPGARSGQKIVAPAPPLPKAPAAKQSPARSSRGGSP
jgi:hypothetical protein